jgi:class 3 adenylate cyclase
MVRPQVKNFANPDDTVAFPKGSASTVTIGEMVVARVLQEPGWRWSEHVRPIVGTPSCQFHHVGVVLSGQSRTRMDDGTELDLKPNDVFDIPPGHDTWVLEDEPWVAVIWGGFRGYGKPSMGDRVLTTLLLTDIVGSTERAARIGDGPWNRLLQQHNETVRDVLEQYRGAEVATTGDGFLVTFDGAARAVHAAVAIRQALQDLDLQIRAAVHTGEVEVIPGNLRGVAVHEAARIQALAEPGEILVSSTTRELATASGLHFEDRGTHRLKGVPDERRVFAVTAEPP